MRNMEKTEVIEIAKNAKDKSNKNLIEARELLYEEFEKAKALIVDLTRHMESVQDCYEIINKELGKRLTK